MASASETHDVLRLQGALRFVRHKIATLEMMKKPSVDNRPQL